MATPLPEALAGGLTAVTGFEKGSGKTTFLNHLLPLARRGGAVALFTIGLDGRQASGSPAVRVEAGDVVMTTEAFARASDARLEVLEAVPGRSALGRLLLGRAVRGGEVTLVGSEHFSTLADVIRTTLAEGWASAALLDGAVSRLTQVATLDEARFVFTARVHPGNLARTRARLEALAALADLPCVPDPPVHPHGLRLEGPLTPDGLAALPPEVTDLSLADFTKSFLEPEALRRVLGRYALTVRRSFPLLGIAVSLRDVDGEAFAASLPEAVRARLIPNPHEVRP